MNVKISNKIGRRRRANDNNLSLIEAIHLTGINMRLTSNGVKLIKTK